MKKRNKILRTKTIKRDNYTCQKCKLQDTTMQKLEAHHVIPLWMGGNDELGNMLTLCFDCHHFAPDKKEEFDEYMEEQIDGTSTTLIKAFNKVRNEQPELFKELEKELK